MNFENQIVVIPHSFYLSFVRKEIYDGYQTC
nr:MAG TPA: hypothetical protein [Caudoviricetes sp.]